MLACVASICMLVPLFSERDAFRKGAYGSLGLCSATLIGASKLACFGRFVRRHHMRHRRMSALSPNPAEAPRLCTLGRGFAPSTHFLFLPLTLCFTRAIIPVFEEEACPLLTSRGSRCRVCGFLTLGGEGSIIRAAGVSRCFFFCERERFKRKFGGVWISQSI